MRGLKSRAVKMPCEGQLSGGLKLERKLLMVEWEGWHLSRTIYPRNCTGGSPHSRAQRTIKLLQRKISISQPIAQPQFPSQMKEQFSDEAGHRFTTTSQQVLQQAEFLLPCSPAPTSAHTHHTTLVQAGTLHGIRGKRRGRKGIRLHAFQPQIIFNNLGSQTAEG